MLEECSLCGLCKSNCPAFNAMKNEAFGPRARALLIKKGILERIFYDCALCGACKAECPTRIDLGLEKMREKLVANRIETEGSKRMIKNLRMYGNVFGKSSL